jgi:CHAT domain-containing protein
MKVYKRKYYLYRFFFLICSFIYYPAYSMYVINNDSIIEKALFNNDLNSALNHINTSLNQNPNQKQKIILLLRKSELYLKSGNQSASGKALDEAEWVMKSIKTFDIELQFSIALQSVKYYMFCEKPDLAIPWLRSAEKYSEKFNCHYNDLGSLNLEMGKYYNSLSDNRTSVNYFQKVLSAQPVMNLSDSVRMITAGIYLTNILWDQGKTIDAKKMVEKWLSLISQMKNPLHPAMIEIYMDLADFHISRDYNPLLSEELLLSATKILTHSYQKDHYLNGKLYYLKSQIEYSKNDFENALQYCRRSQYFALEYPVLSGYRSLNCYTQARIYYWYKQDYERAISYCKQAIDFHNYSKQFLVYVNLLIGKSYKKLTNYKDAKAIFLQIIHHTSAGQMPGDFYTCSNAYMELGDMAQIEKKNELNYNYLKMALYYALKISDKNLQTLDVYKKLGRFFYTAGNYTKALEYFQKSIIAGCKDFSDENISGNPLPRNVLMTDELVESFSFKAYLLFKLYETNGNNIQNLISALQVQEIAVKLTERIVIDIDDDNAGLSLINTKKTTLDNAVSYSVLLYLKTGNAIYAEKAFAFTEKSKMQLVLNHYLQKSKMLISGIPDSLIKKDNQLNHEILELENHLALGELNKEGSNSAGALPDRIALLYGQRDELKDMLKKNYPEYYNSKYEFAITGISDIQKTLKDDQVMLEYHLDNSEIMIFAISHKDFSIHYQLIDNQLQDNIQLLRNALISDPVLNGDKKIYKNFVQSSHFLYHTLIDPVYENIKNKQLIIIPHNELTQIPFEVLISKMPDQDKQTDYKSLSYLIKEFCISYAYSANLMKNQHSDGRVHRKTAIFLPDYKTYKGTGHDTLFPELAGAGREAETIKKISHGRLFSGSLADEHTFKERAGNYGVLHIASHTQLDDKNPALSSLIMSAPTDTNDDGRLYAYELMQLNLNAQLVVLSGCNTGFGILRKNEGLISIARSFLYTGVRTITFTLWQVADDAGAELIAGFYKHLEKGEQLNDALRNAKLEFLAGADPVKAHPFYWAGYVVVGKTQSLSLKRAFSPMYVFLTILGTGIFVLWFFRRKTKK